MGNDRVRRRRKVAVVTLLTLLLAAPTLLFLVDGIYQLFQGGPSGVDAHETMVQVGYWFPVIAFVIVAPMFAASLWLLVRLTRRGP
ncbi:MAG TPA: hypothetical protein VGW38_12125 [Chloroflexota bacterium]|nr:hypothetical protein [Chloroflexota bacterium]